MRSMSDMNCHTCHWFDVPPAYDRSAPVPDMVKEQYRCVYKPPQASILVGQGVGGPQPVPITFWPTNAPNGRCSFWEEDETVADH